MTCPPQFVRKQLVCLSLFLVAILCLFTTVRFFRHARPSSESAQSARVEKNNEVSPARQEKLPDCPGGVSGAALVIRHSMAKRTETLAPQHIVSRHKVILSWNASALSPNSDGKAVGYCIYRRKESKEKRNSAGQPVVDEFKLLNPKPVNGTSCVDSSVEDGAKYYYVTTAVNRNGKPSKPSNEAPARIPPGDQPSPFPPTIPLPLPCQGPSGAKELSATLSGSHNMVIPEE